MSRVSQTVREQVRARADHRCEYCRKPEDIQAYSHQIEHIIALKHGGSSEPDNLAWSCFQCNNNKGSDLSSYDKETGMIVRLFNPRADQWRDHFRRDGGHITGITAIGRVTVTLLQMNHPDRVETREYLVSIGQWVD